MPTYRFLIPKVNLLGRLRKQNKEAIYTFPSPDICQPFCGSSRIGLGRTQHTDLCSALLCYRSIFHTQPIKPREKTMNNEQDQFSNQTHHFSLSLQISPGGTDTVTKELSNCETSSIFRHNSQTIKITFDRIQFLFAQFFSHHQYLIPEHGHPSPEKRCMYPGAEPPHSPQPHTFQTLICFLSQWTCLFWTFQTRRVIHYEAFYIWLLSLTVLFPRSIHAVVFINTSFFS